MHTAKYHNTKPTISKILDMIFDIYDTVPTPNIMEYNLLKYTF